MPSQAETFSHPPTPLSKQSDQHTPRCAMATPAMPACLVWKVLSNPISLGCRVYISRRFSSIDTQINLKLAQGHWRPFSSHVDPWPSCVLRSLRQVHLFKRLTCHPRRREEQFGIGTFLEPRDTYVYSQCSDVHGSSECSWFIYAASLRADSIP